MTNILLVEKRFLLDPAAPNAFLRSALFSVSTSKKSDVWRERIACLGGVDLLFSGRRLTQADLDVWISLVGLELDECGWVRFSSRSLLTKLGRSAGKSDRARLEESIVRLAAGTIELRVSSGDDPFHYCGSLVDEFVASKNENWRVRLNPKLAVLFHGNRWSRLDKAAREALRGKPLALWLHAFYSSHRAPFPYTVEKIMGLCGSATHETFHFRAKLRAALADLSCATGWSCLIDGDKVVVKKTADPAIRVGSPQELADPDSPGRRGFQEKKREIFGRDKKDEEAHLAPLNDPVSESGEAFMAFWAAYHPARQTNFSRAASAWKGMNLDIEADKIMEGLQKWMASQEWKQDEGKYVPSPAKWLMDRRWLDNPAQFKQTVYRDRSGRVVGVEYGDVERDYGKLGAF